MAAGDVVSITILSTGFEADVVLSGLGTGGSYTWGHGTNNDPATGTPKFTITATSLGYTNAAAATTRARTIYGVISMFEAFSASTIAGSFTSGTFSVGETVTQGTSNATAVILFVQSAGAILYVRTVAGAPDNNPAHTWVGGTSSAVYAPTAIPVALAASQPAERYDGTNTTVRVCLSDYIYQKDNTGGGNSGTACVAKLLSGFYTKTAVPNGATGAGFAVTNNSTLAMSRAQAAWAMVPNQRLTSSSVVSRVIGFGEGANSGKPLACVVITYADTHSHTATVTVTDMTIDATEANAIAVPKHNGTLDLSAFTNGDTITRNFQAYPWVGDSTCVVDTTDGVNTMPTPLYAPHTDIYDAAGTYGVTCARVSTAGNDGTGVVADVSTFTEAAAAYLTIGAALTAIKAYNVTNHSRSNCAAGRIVLEDGTYSWTGTTGNYGVTASLTWCEITRTAASTSRATVIISGTHSIGNAYGMGYVKFTDITIVGAVLGLGYGGASFTDKFWFNNSNVALSVGTTIWDSVCYITRANIGNCVDGIGPYANTIKTFFGLVEGASMTGFNGPIHPVYTVLGCLKSDTAGGSNAMFKFQSDPTQLVPISTPILAYCKITKWKGNELLYDGVSYVNATNGAAIVCCVFENIGAGAAPTAYPITDLAGQFSDAQTSFNNLRIWDCTFAGERCNWAYNTHGINAVRNRWDVQNTITEYTAKKSHSYTGDSGGDGARIADWGVLYGVRFRGNFFAACLESASAAFMLEFAGLRTYQPTRVGTTQPPGGTRNVSGYVVFTNRQACSDSGAGAGGGDYSLQVTSPAVGLAYSQLLPFDITGAARGAIDSPGAYTTFAGASGTSCPTNPAIFFRRHRSL